MALQWRCSYSSTYPGGVQVVNTFHVVARPDGGVTTDASASTVRDTLHSALTTKYRACTPSFATVDSLLVRQEVDPTSGDIPPESLQTIGLAGTRTASNNDTPLSMGLLAKLATNAAVRSGHGRMFLPPACDHLALAGGRNWDSTNVYWINSKAFLDELVQSHHAGVVLLGWNLDPIVYSRTRRARGDAAYYFDITGHVMRPAPHWLRSRATAP